MPIERRSLGVCVYGEQIKNSEHLKPEHLSILFFNKVWLILSDAGTVWPLMGLNLTRSFISLMLANLDFSFVNVTARHRH